MYISTKATYWCALSMHANVKLMLMLLTRQQRAVWHLQRLYMYMHIHVHVHVDVHVHVRAEYCGVFTLLWYVFKHYLTIHDVTH